MHVEPTAEHEWLKKFLGEWSYETDISEGPDAPVQRITGVETVRAIGDTWISCELRITGSDGETETNILTLGFDPMKHRYVGSFVSSAMASQWVYEGSLDEAGTTLTLDTEGPNMTDENRTSPYQDVMEWVDDDHRIFSSRTIGPDGGWFEFMRSTYRRVR